MSSVVAPVSASPLTPPTLLATLASNSSLSPLLSLQFEKTKHVCNMLHCENRKYNNTIAPKAYSFEMNGYKSFK